MSPWFKYAVVVGFSFVNKSLLEEISEIRRPMAAGRCCIIVGREWLELVSM